MDASIIVGIISGICTILAVILTNNKSNREMLAKMSQQEAVFETKIDIRMDELTRKVEKHNQVIERTYKLEADKQAFDIRIDSLERRLCNLEKTN